MITLDLVESAQKKWGEGIVKIGSLKNNFKLCKEFTSSFLNETYSFKEGKILFKPTKACEEQFRPNFDMALSYFCLLYTSPSPRDRQKSRMPSSA